MGLMLLVLMPVPYVDASAASVLQSRWHRALIGAAGMVVELFLAALAFYVWLAVEPGLTRAVCFNVMLVAGVSTLVFNGNPLLRYDAYYILGDLIEMPNLSQRAARYWGYLLERHVLRVREATSPAHTAGERAWFAGYGLLSTLYRLFITVAIALFVAAQYFFVGVLLALWAVTMMVVVPVVRGLRHLQSRQALREQRVRIVGAAAALALVVGLLVALVPVPHRTQAEGVIWLPERSILRAGAPGFVSRIEVPSGTPVRAGQLLVHRIDPALDARIRQLEARVAELDAIYGVEFVGDRARAQIVHEQWLAEQAALDRERERAVALPVMAEVDGVFTLPAPQDLPGRWHKQGEVLAYVLGADEPIVRVVVEQSVADLVGTSTRAVAVRLADDPDRVIDARIARQVPAGGDEAPSKALVATGGGRLAADPHDREGRKTLERVFQFDLALNEPLGRSPAFGQLVHVRFDLEPVPLATQGWHALRRLFLRHFDV
jgi:putative peptide zinc metalloprotease protein